MEEFERQDSPIRIVYGTPPTAADPSPSNMVRKEYADGTMLIELPEPTPEVLQEYVEALAQSPESAKLRLAYGEALSHLGDRTAALMQVKEAVRLAPEARDGRSELAYILRELGDYDAALPEFHAALRLQATEEYENEQGEAILRWGLAETLWSMGNGEAASQEIANAVVLQQEAVSRQRGSEQMLQQLREKQAEFTARHP